MGIPIRESKNNKSTFRLCFCFAQKACIEWWVITNTTGSSSCMFLKFPFFPSFPIYLSFLSSNLSSFSVPIFFSLLLSLIITALFENRIQFFCSFEDLIVCRQIVWRKCRRKFILCTKIYFSVWHLWKLSIFIYCRCSTAALNTGVVR